MPGEDAHFRNRVESGGPKRPERTQQSTTRRSSHGVRGRVTNVNNGGRAGHSLATSPGTIAPVQAARHRLPWIEQGQLDERPGGDVAQPVTGLAPDSVSALDPQESIDRLLRDLRTRRGGLSDREAARRLGSSPTGCRCGDSPTRSSSLRQS